ncbi:MAG: cytochrome b/b6 domain-containing protein [Pseudomonadales bacterium]|nr:cytochrome b/b6 domain-containing protein [Halioglobus sp.]MCP5129336.1 cytochrome b/b6 domain-containing protein [Pseudomonadales bacterium]
MSQLLIILVSALLLLTPSAWGDSGATAGECMDCHELQDTPTHAAGQDNTSAFSASVHGDLECTDCHADISSLPHQETLAPVACADCHDAESAEYAASVHSHLELENGPAGCQTCHGDAHLIVPADNADSLVNHRRLAETCGGCHADPELASEYGIDIVNPLAAYSDSVHAAAVDNGNGGPSCNDCHGSHDTLPNNNPASHINRNNVPATCGKCHEEIAHDFLESVHGTAFLRGVSDVPICTDCHGEHRILAPAAAGSPVSPTNQSLISCGGCHGDLRLNQKYGLAHDKVPSYADSFHGLAARGGSTTVASCASCHGVHDILPSTNPASRIHQDNLAKTCSDCHAGAGSRFAIGPIHVDDTSTDHLIVYYIRLVYLILIYGTVGGMLFHVALDFLKKCREPKLRAMAAAPSSGAIRMNTGFRIAHGMVMLSFPVLVWTGFALSYPDAWWAWPLIAPGPEFRGMLHRAAAVLICCSLVFHVVQLVLSREARRCMLQMIPGLDDLREVIERFKYYFGLRKEPVHSPQVGYIEKVEYLAFWWGMIVMTLTGLLLWFENFMLREFPAWVPAATSAVHFYEAVLASLAILIWHGYWTIFDPAVYPMDMSWLTGKSPASREWERGETGPPGPTEKPDEEAKR